MLCYVMLCYVMLCYVVMMLCYVMLCYVMSVNPIKKIGLTDIFLSFNLLLFYLNIKMKKISFNNNIAQLEIRYNDLVNDLGEAVLM